MMRPLGLHQLDGAGAADGDVPTFDVGVGRYVAKAPSGAGGSGRIATQRLHLRKSANQTLPGSSEAFISWDIEKADAWGGFNPATSATDITVDETGIYLVHMRVVATGVSLSLLDVTNSEHLIYGGNGTQNLSGPAYMEVGHTYRVRVFTNTSGSSAFGGDDGFGSNLIIAKMKN